MNHLLSFFLDFLDLEGNKIAVDYQYGTAINGHHITGRSGFVQTLKTRQPWTHQLYIVKQKFKLWNNIIFWTICNFLGGNINWKVEQKHWKFESWLFPFRRFCSEFQFWQKFLLVF